MNYLDELKRISKKIITKTIIIFLVIHLMVFLMSLFSIIMSDLKFNSIFDSTFDIIKYIFYSIFITFFCGYWMTLSICNKDIECYKQIYAKNIVLDILNKNFKDVIYRPNKFSEELSSKLKIPTVDFCYFNYYFSAIYKNIKFEYCDIELYHNGSSRNSSTNEVFKGKWLILSFNNKFKANIQIGPKNFNGKRNGQMLKCEYYKKVNIKNDKFNKKIVIYSNNENEAFNIITPDRIEKLKYLYNNTYGKIFLFFLDNKINIGIGDKKNFFEPSMLSIYKKINLEKENRKIENQIKIIKKLIDYWI